MRATTASFGTLRATTLPSPSGVVTRVPTAGADAREIMNTLDIQRRDGVVITTDRRAFGQPR